MENDMEQQLNAILNDPSAMQNILSMAQSLSGAVGASSDNKEEIIPLKQLAGLASKSGIDQQQSSLLSALSPYLSRERLKKLENAMRAAKMARLATALISGSR